MRGNTPPEDHPGGVGLIVVAGPTAAGKSALAVRLAQRLGGEIVNGDAMQMYAGLDVGTAKPTAEQCGGVPHHLFDLWQIGQPASVAQYQRAARAEVDRIQRAGRPALIVGGSPLYLRAVCDLLDLPPRDPGLRRRLHARAEEEGGAALHRELARRDPAAAAAIDPRNVRRVVRALEVVELTGSFAARMPSPVPWRPAVWLGVDAERDVLDARIEARARAMWSGGMLPETAVLLRRGLATAPTAAKAVGYRQAMAVLAGQMTAAEGLADTIRATRRLARRQQRAFRAEARIRPVAGPDPLATALALLAAGGVSAAAGSTRFPAER